MRLKSQNSYTSKTPAAGIELPVIVFKQAALKASYHKQPITTSRIYAVSSVVVSQASLPFCFVCRCLQYTPDHCVNCNWNAVACGFLQVSACSGVQDSTLFGRVGGCGVAIWSRCTGLTNIHLQWSAFHNYSVSSGRQAAKSKPHEPPGLIQDVSRKGPAQFDGCICQATCQIISWLQIGIHILSERCLPASLRPTIYCLDAFGRAFKDAISPV